MNWISYLFQASLLFFLFYGFYWLFLKEETYHQINRAVLLGIILVIVTLPLIPVPEPVIEIKQQFLPIENIAFTTEIPEETISLPESMEATGPVVAEPTIQINWQKSLLLLYLVGVIALGLRFMFALASIFGLLIWSNLKKQEDFILAFSDRHFQPFSFFKIIFTGRDDQSEKAREQILIHESVHAREWHCIDIILVELFSILFWFHPFTGMLKRSIKLNLEYIADATVLRSGANRKAYQYSLLKVGTNQKDLLLTNSFNHSFIKKRIIMMNIKKSPEWKKLKYLLFLPLFLFSYTFVNTAQAQTVKEPVEKVKPEKNKVKPDKQKEKELEKAQRTLEKAQLEKEKSMIQLEKAQKALAEAQEAEESEEVLETARTRAMLAEVQLVEAQEMMNEIEAVLAEQQTHALEAEAALAEARALETESELAELETAEVEAMLAEAKALDEALKATIAESETVDLGNDNIFLVIQASTKSTFLKEVQQDIRKYGIFFRFTELEYNDNGEITKIALAVKTNSGFSGHAFSYNDGGPIKEPLVFYRVPDEDPPHGIFIGSDKKIPESVKKVMKKMTGYFTGNWE